jgi:pimeloyl-ACP methyl ester carboxylesterase
MPLRTKSRAPKFAQTTHSSFANANGVSLHYLVAGAGDPVVLLRGYAETCYMWRTLFSELAATHTAIASNLRQGGTAR